MFSLESSKIEIFLFNETIFGSIRIELIENDILKYQFKS